MVMAVFSESTTSISSLDAPRPTDVGIIAMEMYFPTRCISEETLEIFDGVPQGKYTIGLGQEYMACVDDREDINSFALSAVSNLLEKYKIDPRSIGRIEVGTETIIDMSKSVKTVLMDLFAAAGNTDIEGVDSKNACYGSTAAVFNAINWIESRSWDGRRAIVFAGDFAVYPEGRARPSGGAGACAMLIGPNAPLVFEPVHGTYMANTYDFFKPKLDSEYPEVDGSLSITSYLCALDASYARYCEKISSASGTHYNGASNGTVKVDVYTPTTCNGTHHRSSISSSLSSDAKACFSLDDIDYPIFHSPYGKLVQKGYARLLLNDFLRSPSSSKFSSIPLSIRETLLALPYADTLINKSIEKTFIAFASSSYKTLVEPSMHCARRCGNMYTASLYGGLASLVSAVEPALLRGKRLSMFAYGGGCAASFYTICVTGDTSDMRKKMDLPNRLASMKVVPCQEYVDALALREKNHNAGPCTPEGSIEHLWPGSYYLESIDEKYKRKYAKVPGDLALAAVSST